VREFEDALRIAEQSGDDVALAIARMTLGIALVQRRTNAERDRGQQVLAEVSSGTESERGGMNLQVRWCFRR